MTDGDLNTAKLLVNEEKLQACLTRLLDSFWSFSFLLPLKNTLFLMPADFFFKFMHIKSQMHWDF